MTFKETSTLSFLFLLLLSQSTAKSFFLFEQFAKQKTAFFTYNLFAIPKSWVTSCY